jgi:FkbM family methyltransferase
MKSTPPELPFVNRSAPRAQSRFDGVANEIWTLAVKTRNGLKRAGILGRLDGLSTYLGPRLLPPPKTDVQAELSLGLSLIVPPAYPSYRNFATGLYETDVTEQFLSFLSAGMTVVDLGANIGYYTLLASRLVGAEGRVYAFEPDLEAYTYLERNVSLNQCTNVAAVHKAASNHIGSLSFIRPGPERGFVSTLGPQAISIDAVTLDAFFSGLAWPAVHLVKIDIEGSEEQALLGMQELVQRNPTLRIIIELNTDALSRAGRSLEQLVETLSMLGFSSGYLIEQRRSLRLRDLLPGSHAVHNLLLSGRGA